MAAIPVKPAHSQLTTIENDAQRTGHPAPVNPFFNFSYFVGEIQITPDQNSYVRTKKIGFENERLKYETFEGYAPFSVFQQAVKDSQRLFAEQANWLLSQFVLNPMLTWTRRDDDPE